MSEEFNGFENNTTADNVETVESGSYSASDVTVEGGEMKTPGIGTAALILAIAAILVNVFACCCTFVGAVSLILAIVATVLAFKASKQMMEQYGAVSGVVKAAKIIGIVAIVIAVLSCVFCVINAILGVAMSMGSMDF